MSEARRKRLRSLSTRKRNGLSSCRAEPQASLGEKRKEREMSSPPGRCSTDGAKNWRQKKKRVLLRKR